MLLLMFFECLACVCLWWGGLTLATARLPEHRELDRTERERRAERVRNELAERPVWWLFLGPLMVLVLLDWLAEKWRQPRWRAALLWTLAMVVLVVALLSLTAHFGWGLRAA